MSVHGLHLLIPEKGDEERDSVADAWVADGGRVSRLGRFWDPPAVDPTAVRLYGNDTFVLVLAQKLGLSLVSPSDDLLVRLPQELLRRQVRVRPLADALAASFPAFIKPVVPKDFRAQVYASPGALSGETAGLESNTDVYVSDVVAFAAEARAFLLHGEVRDVSIYEGSANIEEAWDFVRRASTATALPATCALDVGYIKSVGWAVIEANATWGAGLNGCRAERVLDCIALATAALSQHGGD